MESYPKLVADRTTVKRLVYKTLIFIFDTLDDILCWARPFDKRPEDRVRKINTS